MTLIRGVQGLYPCPVCLVPWDQLSDLSVRHVLRTAEQTQGILREADAAQTRGAAEELLKDYGLRDVKVLSFKLDFFMLLLLTESRTPCGFLKIQIPIKLHPGIICTHILVACGTIISGRRSKAI
jgi:hypothetical protein